MITIKSIYHYFYPDVETLIRWGKYYFERKNWSEAKKLFTAALQEKNITDKNKYDAIFWLSITHSKTESYTEAEENLKRLIEFVHTSPELLSLSPSQRVKLLAEPYIFLVCNYAKQEKYKATIENISKLVEIVDKDLYLLITYINKKEFDNAEKILKTLERKHCDLLVPLANSYYYLDMYDEAYLTLPIIIKFLPPHPTYQLYIGKTCYHLGRYEEASTWFNSLIKNFTFESNTYDEIQFYLAVAYLKLEKFKVAKKIFKNLSHFKIIPQECVNEALLATYNEGSNYYYSIADYKKAEKYIYKVFEMGSKFLVHKIHAGRIFFKQKQYKKTMELLKPEIEKNLETDQAIGLLIVTYYFICKYLEGKNTLINYQFFQIIEEFIEYSEFIFFSMYQNDLVPENPQKFQFFVGFYDELIQNLTEENAINILNSLAQIAAIFNKLEIIKICVEQLDLDIHAKNGFGSTLMHTAAKFGAEDVLGYLLSLGGQVDQIDNDGNTVLHIAVIARRINICKFLLNFMSKNHLNSIKILETANANNETALNLAVQIDFNEVAIELLLAGSSLFIVNSEDYNILQQTVCLGNLELLDFLIKFNNSDITMLSGESLMHFTSRFGQSDVYLYLVEQNIDSGLQAGKNALIEYFVAFQNRKNVQTANGESLLHLAARFERREIIKYLIEGNIDIRLQDADGRTAEQYAKEHCQPAIYHCLKNGLYKKLVNKKIESQKDRKKFRPLCFDTIFDPKFIEAVVYCDNNQLLKAQQLLEDCNSSNAVHLFLAYIYWSDNKSILALKELEIVLKNTETLDFSAVNVRYERDDYAEAYFLKGLIISSFDSKSQNTIDITRQAFNYYQLALNLRPDDRHYKSKRNHSIETLLNLLANYIAKEIAKKCFKLSVAWIDTIKEVLLQENLFHKKIFVDLDELNILAECIYSHLPADKINIDVYEILKPISKWIVSQALSEWSDKYEEYLEKKFLQQASNDNNTEPEVLKLQSNSLVAIMLANDTYAQEHFVAKLVQSLDTEYKRCEVIIKKLAQRNPDKIVACTNAVNTAANMAALYTPLTVTLSAKTSVAAVENIQNLREENGMKLILQLAHNSTEATKLFQRVATKLANCYQNQLAQLSPLAVGEFAEYIANKMIQYVKSEEGKYNGVIGEVFYRIFFKPFYNFFNSTKDAISQSVTNNLGRKVHPKFFPFIEKQAKSSDLILFEAVYAGIIDTEINCGTFVETNKRYEKLSKEPWNIEGLLTRSGIITADGDLYSSCRCDVKKYGFRIDTVENAKKLGLEKIGKQLDFAPKNIFPIGEEEKSSIPNFN